MAPSVNDVLHESIEAFIKCYAGFRILISVIDHQSTSAETDMNVAEDDDTGKHACIK